MTEHNPQKIWEMYRDNEIRFITPVLKNLGFSLDSEQPHTKGERYLMQAVTTESGRKLILIGVRDSDQKKVIIKVSDERGGKMEIKHERACRKALSNLTFSYGRFHSPREILFGTYAGRLVSIQEYIESPVTFLERPIREQFAYALRAFNVQEGVRATTYAHKRFAQRTFGVQTPSEYLAKFMRFQSFLSSYEMTKKCNNTLDRTYGMLESNLTDIERYADFLTHTDFVPHNFKIVGNDIYLLDHSALRFGNKHEGWARFLNFMELYNPPLVEAFLTYMKENRSSEEQRSLYMMRLYRLGEILYYYTDTIDKSVGSLQILNKERINFWSVVLQSVLDNRPVPQDARSEYIKKRDALRSVEEKQRQVGLH